MPKINPSKNKHTPKYQTSTTAKAALSKNIKVGLFVSVIIFCILGYVSEWKSIHRVVEGVDFCNYYITAFAVKQLSLKDIYNPENAISAAAVLQKKAYFTKQELLFATVSCWISGLQQKPTTYHFNASPFLYTVLSVFKFDNYLMSLWTYRLFSLACYVFSVWWLSRRLGYSIFSTGIFILILTSWFGPFRFSMIVLNVDSLQLAALTLLLYLLNLSGWATIFLSGISLGLTFAFKPNIMFAILALCIFWIVNRHFKKLILTAFGAAAGVTTAVLISSAFFGTIHCWPDWNMQLHKFTYDILNFPDNYAPAKILYKSCGIHISAYIAALLFLPATYVIWTLRSPRSQNNEKYVQNTTVCFQKNVLVISTGLTIYLLSGPVVWEHYFIYTIPVMLIAFTPSCNKQWFNLYELIAKRTLVIIAFLCLSIRSLTEISDNIAGLIISIGTLILFALGLWDLWRIGKTSCDKAALPQNL